MKKLKSFVMSLMITNNSLSIARISLMIASYILALLLLSIPPTTNAVIRSIEKPEIEVSANIGEGRLEVFGYGPPHATIVLEGRSIYEETQSQENGYFVFTNARIRIAEQEICLSGLLHNSASSQPVCLTIPAQKYIKIGPIILPPIITMNKLSFTVQNTAIIQGSTTPNSDVKLKFFSTDLDDSSTTGISLPEINTKSNAHGTFSLSIPDYTDQRLRFYAQTIVKNVESGQSTALTVDILPYWLSILRMFTGILNSSKSLLPGLIILLEALFLIWFFLVRKKKKHELMIIENTSLLIEEHPLTIKETNPIQNRVSERR